MPGGRDLIRRFYAALAAKDGAAAEHRDEFSFYRQARQPLRAAGLTLGWTPLARSRVRRGARAALGQFFAPEGDAG